MNLLYTISFKVMSDTSLSKLVYMFNRVLIRIGHKFLLYFFISLILAVLITFVYYKYISRLLKIEEKRILELLKRVFRPLFRKKHKILRDHEIFTTRQSEKKEKRKKMFDFFGSKDVKKGKVDETKEEVKIEEEGGYVMWPPKPKKEEEVFDKLSKLK